MEIEVTPKALEWFRTELTVSEDMGIRFFGKVYGSTNVYDGFSIGMSVDIPEKPIYQEKVKDILFFVEEADAWFFKNYNLKVDYDENLDEPKYIFLNE